MKIGVDVGGTHTDAIIVRGGEVIATRKVLTTPDISSGIVGAVRAVLSDDRVEAAHIHAVMVGTTQFTNSVVERRNLSAVAAIRIGKQSSEALPPFCDWPDNLSEAVNGLSRMVDGGNEYDGGEIVPLDEAALEQVIAEAADKGLDAIAVSSIFSPVNPAMEDRAASLIAERMPGVHLSISHDIGHLGLIQRENATILNSALLRLSETVVDSFTGAFRDLGIDAPLYISQNDGTLMNAGYLRRFPVLTFSSGPTNSMRGAAFLSGIEDAMVVDVGGTTTDVGMLIKGFPRDSGLSVDIGGVPSNFRMPDVLAIGLGGGSRIRDGGRRVGPDSVGHELVKQGLCFGGEVLTATDIAVAAGVTDIGDAAKVRGVLDRDTVANALAAMRETLANAVDRMKTHAGDLPLIAVGGGAFLVPDDLPGISRVIRPERAAVANAIGAALAQVSGEVEIIYDRDQTSRAEALKKATDQATAKATAAGATAATLRVFDIEEAPMSYLAKPAVCLRVKVIGDLEIRDEN